MLWAGTGLKTRIVQRSYLWMHGRRHPTGRYAPHGVEVAVDERADLALRHLLARGGAYEEAEATLIRRHLSRGTPVIELGACIGVISALVRDVIGPSAQHVLVEANPAIARLAYENAIRGAEVRAVELVQGAIDYGPAPTVRFALGGNQHSSRVARMGEEGFDAAALRLSQLTRRLGAQRYALICDIEGAELAMIRAEPEALAACDLAVIELHPGVYPGGEADLADLRARLAAVGLREIERIDDVVAFAR